MDNLPKIGENLESNVKNLFIAGDLTGLPLIKTSVQKGGQLIETVAQRLRDDVPSDFDLVIVGGGAGGLECALKAQKKGLKYVLLERKVLANTIREFTKGKLILDEPKDLGVDSELYVAEATKEEYERRWDEQIRDSGINYSEGEEVTDIKKQGSIFQIKTGKRTITSQTVILAIGSQGSPRKLKVPGEDLDKVHYKLKDPGEYRGKKVAVVGGGDRSCETVYALAEENDVTFIIRSKGLYRPKVKNRQKIAELVEAGKIKLLTDSQLKKIEDGKITVSTSGDETVMENDDVFINVGPRLPTAFLKKIGIEFEKDWKPKRIATTSVFLAVVAVVLYLKRYVKAEPLGKPMYFWYTVLYSLVVLVYGVHVIGKYKTRYVRVRTAFNIFSQGFILFILPEFVLNPRYAYGIGLPWPLNMWTIVANDSLFWLTFAVINAFLIVPLLVLRFGKGAYCSWICGCGCLAETLGDQYRKISPKSKKARDRNKIIYVFLMISFFTTAYLVISSNLSFDFENGKVVWTSWNDVYQTMNLYDLGIDFILATVVGIGAYPILGGRVWCRFICPLAAYMNLLGKKSRFHIVADHKKCITCGRCNKYCEMGIDVQYHGATGEPLTNANTICVGCGMCVEVCPTKVLSINYDRK